MLKPHLNVWDRESSRMAGRLSVRGSVSAIEGSGIAAVMVVLALLVAGCGAGGTSSPGASPLDSGSISYATGPADLVIRASSGGGLLPESMRLAEIPEISVYGDGSIISLGSHGSGSRDPLLPQLIEAQVTANGMTQILGAAREAGALGPDRRYNLIDTYDLWTVEFTVTVDGQTHRMSAFGLGFKGEEQAAPPGEMAARRSLGQFYGRLLDLRAWLPTEAIGTDSAYRPTGIRLYLTRLLDQSAPVANATPAPATPAPGQEVRPWPFASLPESFGTPVSPGRPWYCAVIGPDQSAALGLNSATWNTRWRAAGYLYQVVARPLLPDESGC